jgi:hypothetical protein
MTKQQESPLVVAARHLTDALQRFQAQSSELERLPINSEKSLQRARQGLEACAEHGTKLAESLRDFATAMQDVQLAQQRCVELSAAATQRVLERQTQRVQLQERLALLGQNAREVAAPVATQPEPSEASSGEMLSNLKEVESRLDAVIAQASELCDQAQRDDWNDLQRDTQSLQHQLQAVRNRVLLWRRKLAPDAPS